MVVRILSIGSDHEDVIIAGEQARLVAGAQLLGGGAGPQITGLFATETVLRPALAASVVLFGLSALATVGAVGAIGRSRAINTNGLGY